MRKRLSPKHLVCLLALLATGMVHGHADTPSGLQSLSPQRGTAVITGRVLSVNGQPAANIKVAAMMSVEARFTLLQSAQAKGVTKQEQDEYSKKLWSLTQAETTTDAQGRYRLAGLPVGPYGIYIANQPSGLIAASEEVEAQPGKTVRASDIAFNHGTLIHCTVVDTKTGKPLSGVQVAHTGPHRPIGTPPILKTTDKAGKITFRASPGDNYISISPEFPTLPGKLQFEDDTPYETRGIAKSGTALYAPWDKHVFVLDGTPRSRLEKDKEIKPFQLKAGQARNVTLRLSRVIVNR